MTLLFTCSVPVSTIHGHFAETLPSKARGDMWGATLLFPRVLVLYACVIDTFPFSVHTKVLRKKMNFAGPLLC